MKKLLFLLMVLFQISGYAQLGAANPKYLGNDGVPSYKQFYDNSGNLIPVGIEDVGGTQMISEQWGYGIVRLKNGRQFIDSSMNFSLYQNLLFYMKGDKIFTLSTPAMEFLIISKDENNKDIKAHFKCGYPSVDKNDNNTFYEVLYEGTGLQLLNWKHKKIEESSNYGSVREKNFKLVQQVYVYEIKEEKMINISFNINAFKKKLPEFSANIDSYTVQHKMNWKDQNQIIGLISFLDSTLH